MNRSSLLGLVAPVALAVFASPIAACTTGVAAGSGGGTQAEYDACVASVARPASLGSSDGTVEAAPNTKVTAALLGVTPEKIEGALREKLTGQMHTQLEQSQYYLTVRARCESLRPKPESSGRGGNEDASAAPSSPNPSAGSPGPQGGNAAPPADHAMEASTTNNQIAGVDEADFIKNDTKYIYVASGSKLRIIDAYPAASAHEIASVDVPGEAKKLFVSGAHALVYSAVTPQSSGSSSSSSGPAGAGAGPAPRYNGGCTSYGYDCQFMGDGSATTISIFDIADPAHPALLRTIESSSALIAARRIGDTVHTVLAEAPFSGGSFWSTTPANLGQNPTEPEIAAAFDSLRAINDAAIQKLTVADVLPKVKDSKGAQPAKAIYQSDMPDGASFTTVLSLDLADAGSTTKAVTVISRPGAVFASADALYMAVPHEQSGYGWFDGRSETELSTVHEFGLGTSPLATDYKGSGLVKGRVLNQFSMDEKDGKLRIATTTGHLPSPDAENTLSVMEQQGGQLQVIGAVDHIAPSEDIRSVRFDGDRGYMVTFKKTDPLYVFDLSDPHAPKTLGELKIPGFSVYMHLMDQTHLLTIGYDASDQGDFAWFTGVILQIFDVADPTNPKLSYKETIGTRGSSSEALADHLAFNYFAPKNLLALPMTICEGGDGNGNYGTNMTFSGLMVYDVTTTTGFQLKGKVAHPNATSSTTQGYYDSAACSNWWANASSEVKRSIIMDDYVFSVSDRRIKVNALGALSTDVKELSLE